MNERPIISTELSHTLADPQERVAPFNMNTESVGVIRNYHGNFIVVGELHHAGARRIIVSVGQPGCACGCGAPGRSLFYLPEPEHARLLAKQLTGIADELEREAAAVAAAYIEKAAGK